MNVGRSPCPRLTVVAALFTLALLLMYVTELSPHLVHHVFDPDEHGQPDCPYLALSKQMPELRADPPAIAPPAPVPVVGAFPAAGSVVPAPERSTAAPRAPPLA